MDWIELPLDIARQYSFTHTKDQPLNEELERHDKDFPGTWLQIWWRSDKGVDVCGGSI
jgi:hypothetical protein